MQAALDQARIALKAKEFPAGCVLVNHDKIVSTGRRINSFTQSANELDHAEIIALKNFFKNHSGSDMTGVTAYTTMEPCLMCYSALLLNGIRNIVYAYEDAMGGGTSLPLDRLPSLYSQMKISLVPHVLREESLELFRQFFSDPENEYWKESLLSQYTLSQK